MKFRDLVEEEGIRFVETYKKLEDAAVKMDRQDIQFDGYKCSILLQIGQRSYDALDLTIQLHYEFDIPNLPDNFLETPINYFIGNLKEAVPEFLTKEYLDHDRGRFKITNVTLKYKSIILHMSSIFKSPQRVTEWRMMAQVQDERWVSYNYWIDPNDINQLDPDLSDISDNLKSRTAKAYSVLRKGTIDGVNYEMSPDYMFWILPSENSASYVANVRPYSFKLNGVDHSDFNEMTDAPQIITKKFQNFRINITF